MRGTIEVRVTKCRLQNAQEFWDYPEYRRRIVGTGSGTLGGESMAGRKSEKGIRKYGVRGHWRMLERRGCEECCRIMCLRMLECVRVE